MHKAMQNWKISLVMKSLFNGWDWRP
jgi:hypothetical protein